MLPPDLVMVPLREHVVRTLVLSGPAGREWHPAVTALVDSVGDQPSRRQVPFPAGLASRPGERPATGVRTI
ncbi:hypothetical protein [Lentzea guizhouensis]|nr:hypothetical protein [Lentzea guizhouensis]